MTNWIAANLVTWLFDISNFKNVTESTKTGYIYKTTYNGVATAKMGLDKLFPNSQVNGGILIAIVFAVAVYVMMSKTTFGYQLKACGSNRHAARYAGIADKRNIVISMAIAGGLSAAGASLYYLSGNTEFFWSTYQSLPAIGFNGIPVAMLASCNPIGIIFTALFMSMLDISGLQLTNLTAYNEYITNVIIAVIVYLSAFSLVIKMWIGGSFRTSRCTSGNGERRRREMTFLIQQTLIYAVPLMIVALAGVFAERSGIINLALEGIMVFGAFIGVWFVRILQTSDAILSLKQSGNWVALQGVELLTMLVAAAFGALFSLLLSFASINLRADQTIGGTALNLMAPALVLFFIRIIANQNTLQMLTGDAASWFMIKKSTLGIDKNTDLGFFGETFVNKVYLATYVCILLFIILSILLYKTRFGLRLRACGEHPQAAEAGLVQRLQDALRGHDHFRRARGHGRLRLCADNGKLRLERRRCGLRLPRTGRYDLRQLEAREYRGLLAAVRPLQVHRGELREHRHQRRRRLHVGGDRHQRPSLPHAALHRHAARAGVHVQELPRPQGRGHPLRQGPAVTYIKKRYGNAIPLFLQTEYLKWRELWRSEKLRLPMTSGALRA